MGKFNQADNATARTLLQKAIDKAPDLSEAHASLALCDLMAMLHLWRTDTRPAIEDAYSHARQAIALDSQNASGHGMLGMAACFLREFEESEKALQTAIDLNPNMAIGYGNFAALYGVSNMPDKARAAGTRAFALSPRDPLKSFWRGGIGIGEYVAGNFEACLANARSGLKETPGYASLMRQEAASLGMMGRIDEAEASIARHLSQLPGLTVSQVRNIVPIRNSQDWDLWLDGLRRAGLPE